MITREFGRKPIRSVKPIHVQTWTAKLKVEGYEDSTVYAVYRRLSQILAAAVHNDVLDKNPCSLQIAPRGGRQKPYVATRAQIDAIYAALPEHMRPAVLLGAFGAANGRGGRPADRPRRLLAPVHQPAAPERRQQLKSRTSETPIPISEELARDLSAAVARWGGEYVVTDGLGGPTSTWAIERSMRRIRRMVPGLPQTFVFHDLRPFFASALIEAGFDVKRVQALLRHASATTTLNTYGHLFPDQDDAVRAKLGELYTARQADEGVVELRQAGSG